MFIPFLQLADVLAWSIIAVSILVLFALIGINIYISKLRKKINSEDLESEINSLNETSNSDISEIVLSSEELESDSEFFQISNEIKKENSEVQKPSNNNELLVNSNSNLENISTIKHDFVTEVNKSDILIESEENQIFVFEIVDNKMITKTRKIKL